MAKTVQIGARLVGQEQSSYIAAEIGINHNGDLNLAMKLIDAAVQAGVDAAKFQRRTPEVCVPREQWDIKRETPWGLITYLEYRHRIEFDPGAYTEIDRYCSEKGFAGFASSWDEPSVVFVEQFNQVCYKIPSAALTDDELLKYTAAKGRPLIISTGMSTMKAIRRAVSLFDQKELIVCHSTGAYPCRPAERTCVSSIPCGESSTARSDILDTTSDSLPRTRQSFSPPVSRSATSHLIGQCGEPIRAPRWSRTALSASCATFV